LPLLPYGRLLLNPFQFIVNPWPYHSTTYIVDKQRSNATHENETLFCKAPIQIITCPGQYFGQKPS
jgi:hypothetical protein